MNRRGVFIAIEGIDAVGKKTQTSILNSWLRSKSLSTRTLSFPVYETTIGKEIRKFLAGTVNYPPEVRAMLYAANRWETKAQLDAILSETDATIVNRYTGSNLAYGVSSGLALDWLLNLESGLPEPDVVLVLDAPPANLAPRRGGKDSYERDASLQAKARRAYLGLAAKFGWTVDKIYELFPTLRARDGQLGGYLSGGEQQMLTVGRTLMGNPLLLLLDEPVEGVAPIVVQELGDKIRYLKGLGLTILMAEQNLHFATTISDYAYVIEKGRIRFQGTMQDLSRDEAIKQKYLMI